MNEPKFVGQFENNEVITCICACCVLYRAKIALRPNAYGIILIGQLLSNIKIKIETLHFAINTGVILKTARVCSRYAATLDLSNANAPPSHNKTYCNKRYETKSIESRLFTCEETEDHL